MQRKKHFALSFSAEFVGLNDASMSLAGKSNVYVSHAAALVVGISILLVSTVDSEANNRRPRRAPAAKHSQLQLLVTRVVLTLYAETPLDMPHRRFASCRDLLLPDEVAALRRRDVRIARTDTALQGEKSAWTLPCQPVTRSWGSNALNEKSIKFEVLKIVEPQAVVESLRRIAVDENERRKFLLSPERQAFLTRAYALPDDQAALSSLTWSYDLATRSSAADSPFWREITTVLQAAEITLDDGAEVFRIVIQLPAQPESAITRKPRDPARDPLGLGGLDCLAASLLEISEVLPHCQRKQ